MQKGNTAIITGASRGIGKAIAMELASNGMHIAVISANSADEATRVCRQCEALYGIRAKAYRCDVKEEEQVKATLRQIIQDFGELDVLVNNAGVNRDQLAVLTREEDYDRMMDTNLKGAFFMAKHSIPLFLKKKEGCIVNISSVSGLMGNAGQSAYAASKAGLIGMTKSLAREYASRGIRCNAVAPGFIETDMTRSLDHQTLEDAIPLKRLGKPYEVAQAVSFLIDAAYITGEVVRVDGGLAI